MNHVHESIGMGVCRMSSVGLLLQAQRGRKTPQKHVWEVPGHASRRLPDLEELIGAQARERVQVPCSGPTSLTYKTEGNNTGAGSSPVFAKS